MKSRRSAEVGKAFIGKRLKEEDAVAHDDEWDFDKFGDFHSPEHYRWAVFFRCLNIDFRYQPKHIGVTVDLGLKPTFFLEKFGWFHCCFREPGIKTRLVASMISEVSGQPVLISQEPMRMPTMENGSMPLWYTIGEGSSMTRYFAEIHHHIRIVGKISPYDVTTPRLMDAFGRACNLAML
jgi:hypothetical protein